MKKILIIISTLFILALAATGFWTYTTFFYTKPLTQAELKDLTPDWTKATGGNWSPWYTEPDGTKTWNPTASFNQWLATIPEQDKAWPVIVEVRYSSLDFYLNENIGSYPQELRNWNSFADTIRSQSAQEIIDKTAEALNRPVMGCGLYQGTGQIEHDAILRHGHEDISWNPNQRTDPPVLTIWQSSLSFHRSSINWLQTGAIVALLDGDSDRFVSLHETILKSANLSNEYPNLISQLVYMMIVAEGTESIRWALQYHPEKLNALQLSKLDKALAQHASLQFIWEGEAFFVHDTFRRIGGTDGNLSIKEQLRKMKGSGLPVEGPAANMADTKLDQSIARPLLVHNRVLTHAAKNASTRWFKIDESSESVFIHEYNSLNSISKLMLEPLAPAFDNASQRFRQEHQDIAATRAVISIFQYKVINGHFPDSLEDLNIDLSRFTDEFTGKPLLYIKTDQSPIVYSVGNNLKDDNAQRTESYTWLTIPEAKNILVSNPDSITGDFIYFPEPPMTIKDADYDEEWERKTYGDD